MTLLAELLDCRFKGESAAACIVRLYQDDSSPMNAAAREYVDAMHRDHRYRDANPKIDIYRDGTERADLRYVGSTNFYRTCRDALIHKMLAGPNTTFKAVRGK